MNACYKDRLEPCNEDCPGCEYANAKECDFCGYSGHVSGNMKFYAHGGYTLCEDCLIREYSKEGKNLHYEFLQEMQDEYREFVLDYFEEDMINE